MPFPWIPGEVLYETGVIDRVERGFLARGRRVPGHLERCLGVLLREYPDLPMVGSGHGVRLVGRQLNAPIGRGPLEFKDRG